MKSELNFIEWRVLGNMNNDVVLCHSRAVSVPEKLREKFEFSCKIIHGNYPIHASGEL